MINPIGEKVKELRIKKGWRQIDLAQKSGLNLSIIQRLESGHTGTPYYRTIILLCKAFEILPETLFPTFDL